MKDENKKSKRIFFTFLSISIVSFAVILFTDISGYKTILESDPKVDKQIYTEWGEREFSLSEIGE